MSEYYPWPRNEFKVKDPTTSTYVGNVIGNVSMEEQISQIFDAGNTSLAELNTLGNTLNEQIAPRKPKFVQLWEIINTVNNAIMQYYGETE